MAAKKKPAGPTQVDAIVHGDKRTYIRPWFSTLSDAGIAWFTINYRLAPQWKHPAAMEDIESAVRWIQSHAKRLGVDPRRLVVMGEAGGGPVKATRAAGPNAGGAGPGRSAGFGLARPPRGPVGRGARAPAAGAGAGGDGARLSGRRRAQRTQRAQGARRQSAPAAAGPVPRRLRVRRPRTGP